MINSNLHVKFIFKKNEFFKKLKCEIRKKKLSKNFKII